ncbi:unnamed protein product, partial [Prorocentrum cordatum]
DGWNEAAAFRGGVAAAPPVTANAQQAAAAVAATNRLDLEDLYDLDWCLGVVACMERSALNYEDKIIDRSLESTALIAVMSMLSVSVRIEAPAGGAASPAEVPEEGKSSCHSKFGFDGDESPGAGGQLAECDARVEDAKKGREGLAQSLKETATNDDFKADVGSTEGQEKTATTKSSTVAVAEALGEVRELMAAGMGPEASRADSQGAGLCARVDAEVIGGMGSQLMGNQFILSTSCLERRACLSREAGWMERRACPSRECVYAGWVERRACLSHGAR